MNDRVFCLAMAADGRVVPLQLPARPQRVRGQHAAGVCHQPAPRAIRPHALGALRHEQPRTTQGGKEGK